MDKFILIIFSIIFLYSCEEKPEVATTNSNIVIANPINDINKEIAANPSDVTLLVKKAKLCKESLDFPCVFETAAKAYRTDSTNIDARSMYAWSLINNPTRNLNDIYNARRHFEYVLAQKPQDVETYVNLANTYSLTGDFKSSYQYINEGLKIDNTYRDAYVLKGSNYKLQGNMKLAASSYETAIQMDPEFVVGYLNVADFYIELGNTKVAKEYYQTAIDLNPKNHQLKLKALYGFAKSNQDLGEFEDALVAYRALSNFDSTFVYAFFNSGYIKQFEINELDSAIYYYDKALDLQPNFVDAWHNLGLVYYTQNRKSDAARAFSNALKIDPDSQATKDAVELLK